MIPDFDMTIEGTDYRTIGYVDTGSGYDWSVTAILRRKSDGALFLASDAGCSCSYFGDQNPIDRQVYTVAEAIRDLEPRLRELMRTSVQTREQVYA